MYHRVRGQPQRQLFVARERAYHGVNFGGVALAGMVNNRRAYGPGLAGVYHMRPVAPTPVCTSSNTSRMPWSSQILRRSSR